LRRVALWDAPAEESLSGEMGSGRQPQRKVDMMIAKAAFLFTSLFLLASVCSGLIAAELHVAPPPLGNNKNPGTEVEPFATIQRGINAASDGDTVIVTQGTYVENIEFQGKNIFLRSTDPTDWNVVKGTVIDGNQAGSVVTFWGTEDETCVLSGFTIRNGTGTYVADPTFPGLYGGGIIGAAPGAGASRTHATIQNNIITGNSAETGGGGGVNDCDGLIRNNIIIGNSCVWGGGIGFCHGAIENNLIVGNSATTCGGGITFSNVDFRNNVVVGNAAPGTHGGGLSHLGTSPYGPAGGSISNCMIWGNTSPTGPQVHDSVVPSHCCIQDWTGGGEGNTPSDPRFFDPDGPDDDPNTFEDNDYHLSAASACIDAGTNEDWMNGATDLDGNPRILLGALSLTVDIGAYEYKFSIAITETPENNVELSWIMRPLRTYAILSTFDLTTTQPWVEETTISGGKSGGPAAWVDVDATSTLKFYRIGIK